MVMTYTSTLLVLSILSLGKANLVREESDKVHICSSSLFSESHYIFPQAIEDETTDAGLSPELKHTFGTLMGLQAWIPALKTYETPLIVRFTHLIDRMNWNCAASYSEQWKDFLTKGDPLVRTPRKVTTSTTGINIELHNSDLRYQCMIHAWSTVVQDWVPEAADDVLAFIDQFEFTDSSRGYDDDVIACFDNGAADATCLQEIAQSNCYKPSIMGAIVGQQIAEYARTDGWNMYGSLNRDGTPCAANCRRYNDPTGYEPKRSSSKKYWRPMIETNGRGYETKQQHVTAHIGILGTPSTMTREELELYVAPPPDYKYNTESKKVIRRMRKLTDEKKMMIEFFDDKLDVIMTLIGEIVKTGASFEQVLNYVVGATGAEYDAILVSWKEKVKHDLIRPTSWIQSQWADKTIHTWVPMEGAKQIKGKNFEAFVRVMPHSEYLSGSGCICQTLMEYTDEWLLNNLEMDSSIAVALPEFLPGTSKTEPNLVPLESISVTFENMTDLRNACGESRLDGGMHFSASVSNSYDLCSGIGNISAELVDNLW